MRHLANCTNAAVTITVTVSDFYGASAVTNESTIHFFHMHELGSGYVIINQRKLQHRLRLSSEIFISK